MFLIRVLISLRRLLFGNLKSRSTKRTTTAAMAKKKPKRKIAGLRLEIFKNGKFGRKVIKLCLPKIGNSLADTKVIHQ